MRMKIYTAKWEICEIVSHIQLLANIKKKLRNMIKSLLIFGLLFGLLYSCKKDNTVDYKTKYIGNFTFTVVRDFWSIDSRNNWSDTLNYDGTIKLYSDGDNLNDLSSFDSIKNASQRFTIVFLKDIMITPEILYNGTIREIGGYHYHHVGGFVNNDEIQFVVDRLGGLGGGTNYSVIGKRKD